MSTKATAIIGGFLIECGVLRNREDISNSAMEIFYSDPVHDNKIMMDLDEAICGFAIARRSVLSETPPLLYLC